MTLSGWRLVLAPAGAFSRPSDVTGESVAALVPGTVAQSLEAAGLWSREAPTPLHDKDVWYCADISGHGEAQISFDGLMGEAVLFLDDHEIARSRTAYAPLTLTLNLNGAHRLAILFPSLTAALAGAKPPRARWRNTMVEQQALRAFRVTPLGHMSGWTPAYDAIGPYRPVSLASQAPAIRRFSTHWHEGTGTLSLAFEPSVTGTLHCAGASARLVKGEARLTAEGVDAWWPHTHGTPQLYPLTLETEAGETIPLPLTGFRALVLDREADGDGFGLIVNGEPVFARGTVFVPPDAVSLAQSEELLRPVLQRYRDAGFTMLRLSGAVTDGAETFYRLCDELGLMVFADFPFANFDYPQDEAFLGLCADEARAILARIGPSPALAVLCGGSEVFQQAAMMGLPDSLRHHALFEDHLPALCAQARPDVPYAPSSPYGGDLPFTARAGLTHYYGVGAYLRPLEDARRAAPRFAAECLAFAHMPDEASVEALGVPAVHHPVWKERVPRDRGASWDFEDVREHYERLLFGVDPASLRRDDPLRYRDIARLAGAEVLEKTLSEWRRPGSVTKGALLWLGQDFRLGAGWGLIDASGRPKPALFGAKRACQPVQVILSDEGTNGFDVHVLNETGEAVEAELSLTFLRDGVTRIAGATRALTLAPRSAQTISAYSLLGAFLDVTHAYRFGPPSHDVSAVRLTHAGGVSRQVQFLPRPLTLAPRPAGLKAERLDATTLRLTTERALRGVIVDDKALIPDDNAFVLLPGEEKILRFVPFGGSARAEGALRAVDAADSVYY